MAIANTLNTNEVKNAAGAEVEFEHESQGPGRVHIWKQIGAALNRPHKLSIKHEETGSGLRKVRRSMTRIDKVVASDVDPTATCTVSFYNVAIVPIGLLSASTEVANVIAEGMSFLASQGANTTILYDCTGNGAKALLEGSL